VQQHLVHPSYLSSAQECRTKAPSTPQLEYVRPATFQSVAAAGGRAPATTAGSEPFTCNVEVYLEGGKPVKFTNNSGYFNFKQYVDAVNAFSHWSYQATDGALMVTDLQVGRQWLVNRMAAV
jgi:hypothetical protein